MKLGSGLEGWFELLKWAYGSHMAHEFNFFCSVFAFVAVRCLMVPLLCCPWPQWWPPRWPMGLAAPGMPSASSSPCASGGSRGSLMVRHTNTLYPSKSSLNLKATHKIHRNCQSSSSSSSVFFHGFEAAKWPHSFHDYTNYLLFRTIQLLIILRSKLLPLCYSNLYWL